MDSQKERVIILVNVEYPEQNKYFTVTEYINMGTDICDNSIVSKILTAYNEIDNIIENDKLYRICCKGCNDCCSDYFKISITEFFTLLYGISDNLSLIKYSDKAKSKIKNVIIPECDKDNVIGFPECIFVDDIDGGCKVYKVRPSMCRIYGNLNGITKCPKVLSNTKAKENLIEVDTKIAKLMDNNIDHIELNNKHYRLGGHQPIIYWFAKLDENGELKTRKMKDLFYASFNHPVEDFIKILLIP